MDNITDEPEIVKQLKHEEKLGLFHNRAKSQYCDLESVEKSSNIGLDEPDVFAENVDTNDVIGGNLNDKQDASNLFETIANTTSDFICLTKFKMNPTYVYVNPAYEKVLGYTPDEMIGKSTWDFVHPDDKKNLMPLLKKYLGMKVKKLITRKETTISENFESSIRDKSGNWHYLESTANIIGENLLFISKDVTERKKAEETLKESEEKFKSLYFSMNEGVCLHEII